MALQGSESAMMMDEHTINYDGDVDLVLLAE